MQLIYLKLRQLDLCNCNKEQLLSDSDDFQINRRPSFIISADPFAEFSNWEQLRIVEIKLKYDNCDDVKGAYITHFIINITNTFLRNDVQIAKVTKTQEHLPCFVFIDSKVYTMIQVYCNGIHIMGFNNAITRIINNTIISPVKVNSTAFVYCAIESCCGNLKELRAVMKKQNKDTGNLTGTRRKF